MGGMRYVTWGKLRYMGREITLIARGDSKGEEKGGGAGRNSRAGLRQVFCGVPRTRRPLLLFTLAKRVDGLSAGVTEYVLSSPRSVDTIKTFLIYHNAANGAAWEDKYKAENMARNLFLNSMQQETITSFFK